MKYLLIWMLCAVCLNKACGQTSPNELLHYEYFIDTSNRYSCENVGSVPFIADDSLPLKAVLEKGQLWIRVTFQGPISEPDSYVFACFQDGDYSTMYVPTAEGIKCVDNKGSDLKFLNYFLHFPIQAFEFPTELRGDTLYFQFNHWMAFGFNPILLKKKQFVKIHYNQLVGICIGVGILLLIMINNLWYYFFTRQSIYLLYALYALSLTGLVAIYFWLDYPFLWFFQHHHVNYLIIGSSFLAQLYCIKFLELEKVSRFLNRVVLAEIGVTALLFVCLLFGFTNALVFEIVYPAITLATFFICAVVAVYKKNLLAHKFYLAGVASFLLSMVGWGVATFNFTPDLLYLQLPFFIYGIVFEGILMWIGLHTKIANEKKEAELAKKQAQEELAEFQREQNKVLAEKIREQTYELKMTNEEVTAQNEELTQLNEELEAQRGTLSIQNGLIERQNIELKKIQEGLEQAVILRTHELTRQNLQLEQFAFMTAHNLRGPVARLLGLTDLFNKLPQPELGKEIIEKIQFVATEFDTTLNDISTILEVRKGVGAQFALVSLTTSLDKVMRLLQHEIETIKPQINVDFEVKEIYGIEPYLTSIFYNLISNSLKFKKDSEGLVISLHTTDNDKSVIFTYSDNGIGFDMKQAGEKVFQPFKRFHLHRDGKGLGLYLIKIQADTMGATTAVATAPNEGFTLRLTFHKLPT
jgi:signal transduction histidine kinase